jgi:hypothetical protein
MNLECLTVEELLKDACLVHHFWFPHYAWNSDAYNLLMYVCCKTKNMFKTAF